MTAPKKLPTAPQIFVRSSSDAPWEYMGSDLEALNKIEFHLRPRFQPRFADTMPYFSIDTTATAQDIIIYRLFKVRMLLGVGMIQFDECWSAFREQFSHLPLGTVLGMFEAEAAAYDVLPTGRPLLPASDALALLDVRVFVSGPAPVLWSFVLTLMILVGVALS